MDRFFPPNSWEQITNWWLTYPPEKYEFVRWDHHPNYWGKYASHVPNHQPVIHHNSSVHFSLEIPERNRGFTAKLWENHL